MFRFSPDHILVNDIDRIIEYKCVSIPQDPQENKDHEDTFTAKNVSPSENGQGNIDQDKLRSIDQGLLQKHNKEFPPISSVTFHALNEIETMDQQHIFEDTFTYQFSKFIYVTSDIKTDNLSTDSQNYSPLPCKQHYDQTYRQKIETTDVSAHTVFYPDADQNKIPPDAEDE